MLKLTQTIQWARPGRHWAVPRSLDYPIQEEHTEATAAFLGRQLQNLRAVGAAAGAFPFGCIDHRNEDVAFEALEFFWAGTDPRRGGVFLRVRWLDAGREAIASNSHVEFSARYRFNAAEEVKTFFLIGPNVGSLVTFAARRTISIKASTESM